ncbi:acyltransferase family protein [Adhaeribacter soli]|uniref:Acyltransferase n=1 Tax=Adhaeribacter soli TaxID=2607655 RepID=A0A5N1IL20_9BACT|nr:acyltransferase [Adhaeribacter soli]KAA9327384.1 acyltransferase [Adhaeribacter soli]
MLSNEKMPLLHAVRGFAAFYVVVFHAKYALWSGGKDYISKFPRSEWGIFDYLTFALDMLSANGTAMVIVFFVLSGFFIAYSFDKNAWPLKDFFINRAIRIYVPFLFSVLLAVGVLWVIKETNPVLTEPNVDRQFNNRIAAAFTNLNFAGVVSSLFFLPYGQNKYIGFNMVYWSLLYEAIFYLLIPVTINRLKPYLLISIGALFISSFYRTDFPLLRYFLEFSIYFAAGLSLFHYMKANPGKKPMPETLLQLVMIALFLATVLFGLLDWIRWGHILAGALSILLIIYIINYDVRENLVIRFFKKLGVISYTLYLIHFPILILLYSMLNKITGVFVFYDRIYWIGVAIATLVSFPLYALIEEKSIRVISTLKKKKLASKKAV